MFKYLSFALLVLSLVISSCDSDSSKESKTSKVKKISPVQETIQIPTFNSDSAYSYVEKQVLFGPRVPNTEVHKVTANYLLDFFKAYSDKTFSQDFQIRAYNGTILNGRNIIVQYNPEMKRRILLSAHWDTRPYSDHDADKSKFNNPIDGANDGASGVGVLMEMARAMSQQKPNIGVDIILFDLEDYGDPSNKTQNSYGLGSQYWAQNPHQANYTAEYGILLDMVGAGDAQFLMEYFSLNFASDIVKKVWKTAAQNGYGDYFPFEPGTAIEDDHYYVNQYLGIPMIDIIHLNPNSVNGTFFDHWHTSEDTMNKIDKNTLKAVGETLLHVIYEN